MTPHERKAVCTDLLGAYMEATADRKAHCGQLSIFIRVLRRVVTMYDNGTLQVQMNPAPSPPTLEDGSAAGYRIPTHEELMDAIVACRKAEQHEELARVDAINGGVEPEFLPSPATPKKAFETITVARPLA